MTVQLPIHLDKPGFINWVERQEGRYELVGGRVVMMPGASRGHGLIVRNLVVLLHNQLDPREWTVIADFGLDLGPETLRYPDIVVDRAGGGVDAEGVKAAVNDGTEIAVLEIICRHDVHADLLELVGRVRNLHPINAAAVVEPANALTVESFLVDFKVDAGEMLSSKLLDRKVVTKMRSLKTSQAKSRSACPASWS